MAITVEGETLRIKFEGKKPHLFVSVLAGGGNSPEAHYFCRDALKEACKTAGIDFSLSINAGTGVDRARNMELAKFMASGASDWLLLDNDIVFNPQWVLAMVATNGDDVVKPGIIGGAYPRKNINYESIHAAVKKGVPWQELHKFETDFIINGWKGRGFVNQFGTFAEIREVGTGFMLVKRWALEKMVTHYFEDTAYVTDYEPRDQVHVGLFMCQRDEECGLELAIRELKAAARDYGTDSAGSMQRLMHAADKYYHTGRNLPHNLGRYLTEDYSFCRKAERIGIKCFVYMDAAVHHIGQHVYSAEIKCGMKVKDIDAPDEIVGESGIIVEEACEQ